MASLFNRDPRPGQGAEAKPGPYSRERIEKEVAHLHQRKPVRHLHDKPFTSALWLLGLLAAGILVLYLIDPPLHAYYRGEAIRTYLYLRHYGSDKKLSDLASSGMFTPAEMQRLNQRAGAFQSYYPSPLQANAECAHIVSYLHQVALLQQGSYAELTTFQRLRYQLFLRFGIHPPTKSSLLDPVVTTN